MKVTEFQFEFPEASGPDAHPRASGIHVSDVIRDLVNTVVKPGQRPPMPGLGPGDEALTRFTMGFLWERILQRALAEEFGQSCVRPGECHLDGITGTPDLLDLGNGRLEEWKATWMSSLRGDAIEKEFWEYLVQIKTYLKLTGLSEANLRAFFVNGNYRGSGPLIRCWNLQFAQREIDENWQMILRHARSMK